MMTKLVSSDNVKSRKMIYGSALLSLAFLAAITSASIEQSMTSKTSRFLNRRSKRGGNKRGKHRKDDIKADKIKIGMIDEIDTRSIEVGGIKIGMKGVIKTDGISTSDIRTDEIKKGIKGVKMIKRGGKRTSGSKGTDVSKGIKGAKGTNGTKGKDGTKGTNGTKGAKFVKFKKGHKGNKGHKGIKGHKPDKPHHPHHPHPIHHIISMMPSEAPLSTPSPTKGDVPGIQKTESPSDSPTVTAIKAVEYELIFTWNRKRIDCGNKNRRNRNIGNTYSADGALEAAEKTVRSNILSFDRRDRFLQGRETPPPRTGVTEYGFYEISIVGTECKSGFLSDRCETTTKTVLFVNNPNFDPDEVKETLLATINDGKLDLFADQAAQEVKEELALDVFFYRRVTLTTRIQICANDCDSVQEDLVCLQEFEDALKGAAAGKNCDYELVPEQVDIFIVASDKSDSKNECTTCQGNGRKRSRKAGLVEICLEISVSKDLDLCEVFDQMLDYGRSINQSIQSVGSLDFEYTGFGCSNDKPFNTKK